MATVSLYPEIELYLFWKWTMKIYHALALWMKIKKGLVIGMFMVDKTYEGQAGSWRSDEDLMV